MKPRCLTQQTPGATIVLMFSKAFFAVYNRLEQLWFSWWRFWFKTTTGKLLLTVFGIVIIGSSLMLAQYYAEHKDEPTQLGVSFSTKYAQELDLDWEETYRALVEDLGFKNIRIMSYWDEYEKEPGEYNFANLDKQFEIAEQNGVSINLSVGARQPRWPECHEPDWAKELQAPEYKTVLLKYLEKVVNRYRNSPALEQYQLENEYLLTGFGECPPPDRQRLTEEFELIKELDPVHPVAISVSNQHGTPVRQPVGDSTGISIYTKGHAELMGLSFYWDFWYVPPQWHGLRAAFIELAQDSDVFVHELQAEPWGPKATVDLTLEEQNHTMDAAKIRRQVNYAEATGMNEIFMWGGEWWYWRATEFGDDSLWEEVRSLVN